MSDWPMTQLADIATKIGSGATPHGGKESYKAEGLTLIRSLNVYDFKFERDGLAFIDEAQAKQLSNVAVEKNDILLNITGASVARCCMVPFTLLPARVNQHVAIVRINPKLANSSFILYAINSPIYKHHLLSLAQGGATREALTKETIESFKVPLPALATQNKIAAVLSAYDDLIENNTRRIQILEEMAQALYREWFVHFRFPGHEQSKMVESTLGLIPEGWAVEPLKSLASVKSGFAFKSGDFVECGQYPLVTIKNVHDGKFVENCSNHLDNLPNNMPSYCHIHSGDILLSLTGNIGRVCFAYGTNYLLNQRVAKLIPLDKDNAAFVYSLFRSPEMKTSLESMANGVAQQNLSPVMTASFPVLSPEKTVMSAFSKPASAMLAQVTALFRHNKNLRETRDLLLPKLISGEVAVDNLDVELGNAKGMSDGLPA